MISVVHNKGPRLAHVNISCRHISGELHIFIPGQSLIWEVRAALWQRRKATGQMECSQSLHLKVTCVTSHYLNGQRKSLGQTTVQVLLRSDTLFLNEGSHIAKHFFHQNSFGALG